MKIQSNISLKKYTTFKIGGTAKYFVQVKNLLDLKQSVIWAKNKNLPIFILGKGSNLLVNDDGFVGLVVKIKNEKIKFKNNLVCVGAGIDLNFLIKKCLKQKLIGLENLFGIPGSVGGAVRGNAGAWAKQISDFVESVTAFDIEKLEEKEFTNSKCDFSYRQSIFKTNPNLIIWSVKLNLQKGNIQEAQEIIKQNLQKRKNSQPHYPSAGCVFKNLKKQQFKQFIKHNSDLEMPRNFIDNQVVPVAWLIDLLNLKGLTVGDAQISNKHANFIVNKNNASAKDIVSLISVIKTKIRDRFNIQLQLEIQFVGF